MLRFENGEERVISVEDFRNLPRERQFIVRDEYWDHFGGRAAQNEIEQYLYGK